MARIYTSLVRPILFSLNPERAHGMTLRTCAVTGRVRFLRRLVRAQLQVTDPRLRQTIAGICFDNPIGLAAGFDKNGVAIGMLAALGFGHIEIGSVSARPASGNRRPRLFRLPADESIVVHYGVPNDGADVVARRILDRDRASILGINIVKTNDPSRPTTDDEVLGDYAAAFSRLQGLGQYINLNMSCPNSANDRNYFDDIPRVYALLVRLAAQSSRTPVFLKIKPTADRGMLRELLAVADQFPFVAGFGINLPPGKPSDLRLTTPRTLVEKYPGAVSGRPVENLINANLKLLYEAMGPGSRYKLFAAGGVYTAADAYKKIRLGASLVQLYTTLIYRGPWVVRDILRGLLWLLERDGLANVSEAVGADAG
jgi:dihydroorotate dehydrogenase